MQTNAYQMHSIYVYVCVRVSERNPFPSDIKSNSTIHAYISDFECDWNTHI